MKPGVGAEKLSVLKRTAQPSPQKPGGKATAGDAAMTKPVTERGKRAAAGGHANAAVPNQPTVKQPRGAAKGAFAKEAGKRQQSKDAADDDLKHSSSDEEDDEGSTGSESEGYEPTQQKRKPAQKGRPVRVLPVHVLHGPWRTSAVELCSRQMTERIASQ